MYVSKCAWIRDSSLWAISNLKNAWLLYWVLIDTFEVWWIEIHVHYFHHAHCILTLKGTSIHPFIILLIYSITHFTLFLLLLSVLSITSIIFIISVLFIRSFDTRWNGQSLNLRLLTRYNHCVVMQTSLYGSHVLKVWHKIVNSLYFILQINKTSNYFEQYLSSVWIIQEQRPCRFRSRKSSIFFQRLYSC